MGGFEVHTEVRESRETESELPDDEYQAYLESHLDLIAMLRMEIERARAYGFFGTADALEGIVENLSLALDDNAETHPPSLRQLSED